MADGLISKIFGDAKSCNLTISCRGRYFQAHKKVVCAQSAVLGKACFREASGCLTLYIDDDPVVLEAMLQFLYTKNYGDKGRELGNGVYRDALMWHLLVRGIAKKYQLSTLGNLAADKFTATATREWNTPAFAKAIKYLYAEDGTIEKELRENVVLIAAKHVGDLFNNGAEAGVEFRKAVRTAHMFAEDLSVSQREFCLKGTWDFVEEKWFYHSCCGQWSYLEWGFEGPGRCEFCDEELME